MIFRCLKIIRLFLYSVGSKKKDFVRSYKKNQGFQIILQCYKRKEILWNSLYVNLNGGVIESRQVQSSLQIKSQAEINEL